jgi:hypothetical protein
VQGARPDRDRGLNSGESTRRNVLASKLGATPVKHVTADATEDVLRAMELAGLSPLQPSTDCAARSTPSSRALRRHSGRGRIQ